MTDKLLGYGLSAGVIAGTVVAFPPLLAFSIGLRIATAPTMRRFSEQLEDELAREDAQVAA